MASRSENWMYPQALRSFMVRAGGVCRKCDVHRLYPYWMDSRRYGQLIGRFDVEITSELRVDRPLERCRECAEEKLAEFCSCPICGERAPFFATPEQALKALIHDERERWRFRSRSSLRAKPAYHCPRCWLTLPSSRTAIVEEAS